MRCVFATTILLLAAGATADVFKCVDPTGQPSYQATSCEGDAVPVSIDLRYSNSADLGLDDESQAVIDEIHAERARRAASAIDVRQAAIDDALESHARRDARCQALKESLQALYQLRRYRQVDRDNRDDLARRMRRACSP